MHRDRSTQSADIPTEYRLGPVAGLSILRVVPGAAQASAIPVDALYRSVVLGGRDRELCRCADRMSDIPWQSVRFVLRTRGRPNDSDKETGPLASTNNP